MPVIGKTPIIIYIGLDFSSFCHTKTASCHGFIIITKAACLFSDFKWENVTKLHAEMSASSSVELYSAIMYKKVGRHSLRLCTRWD